MPNVLHTTVKLTFNEENVNYIVILHKSCEKIISTICSVPSAAAFIFFCKSNHILLLTLSLYKFET